MGSEMCIRDRIEAAPLNNGAYLTQTDPTPPSGVVETQVPLAEQGNTNAAKAFFNKINEQLKPVDKWFGENIVGPLAGVIFNGLWTGDWTDSEGVEHKGWLGTTVPFIVIWLLVGAVFFTVYMGLINVRGFWHAIRLTKGDYDNPDDHGCLLYTSPSPRDGLLSRMPSSA